MSNDRAEPSGGADPSGRFHTVQPLRDLESNWGVDLAKNLEDYLIKICSGDLTNDDPGHFSVNFAEAALLLQGSVQVYSRKVEYLYSLVIHALEFVSQKKQLDQPEDASAEPEESGSGAVPEAEDDCFWGLDDIPVEAKISLDGSTRKDALQNDFVKPPANLVVLEGDCLDAGGDGNELESYLVANSDLYRDFILLDPCDAVTVDDYIKSEKTDQGPSSVYGASPVASKSRKAFQSPINRSGGSRLKSAEKSQNINHCPPSVDHRFENNDANIADDFPAHDACEDMHEFGMDGSFYDHGDLDHSDDEDEDDPWKPLDPHEPGNLRIKPFKKVKTIRRQSIASTKQISVTTLFPLAKIHGTISSEFNEVWEVRQRASEGKQQTQSPPLFEKLRESLVHGGDFDSAPPDFGDHKDAGEDNDGDFDSSPPDFDMPENTYNYEEVPMDTEMHDDHGAPYDVHEGVGPEDQSSQGTLEDLCRSHLDALLASIAESEKQTELATRVSTWKQRIESNIQAQDSRRKFDIHKYGEEVLDKLSSEAGTESAMSFTDVVSGKEKHDIARTFSALLQLVNNGDVNIERGSSGSEPSCFTAANPFYVRLLKPQPRVKMSFKSPKKGGNKPPMKRGSCRRDRDKPGTATTSSPPSASVRSIQLGKCTPESKRRRKSRLVEQINLPSAG